MTVEGLKQFIAAQASDGFFPSSEAFLLPSLLLLSMFFLLHVCVGYAVVPTVRFVILE